MTSPETMSADSIVNEDTEPTVLIIGAGINGAAVARELAINGVNVCVVDVNDIAYGATSRSSRLIHGGLRYLEYGDFRLVRESLVERTRLLKTAPQFVKPLRLYIPVSRRRGGFVHSALRFLKLNRTRLGSGIMSLLPASRGRGLWIVRLGLCVYDWLARGDDLPNHGACSVTTAGVPAVDGQLFRWLCAYSDAQIVYPERFVLALLEDARASAEALSHQFELHTHCHVQRAGGKTIIRRVADDHIVRECSPQIIINATGAWGDATLAELEVPSERLFGGTKGSHFFTRHEQLRATLGANGVYAEAADGRLVFILPFPDGVMVGTTDERFEADPGSAVASADEIDYLLGMVNQVLADVKLTRDDVEMHYSGVRPLPFSSGGKASAIPRGHWIVRNDNGPVPVYTLVGGKLTTCRSLGEEVADSIFQVLDVQRSAATRERVVPGGEGFPKDAAAVQSLHEELAAEFSIPVEQVNAVWQLCGTRTAAVLRQLNTANADSVAETDLLRDFVRWVIDHEWAHTLSDLVERRLMLLYDVRLSERCLRELAQCLCVAGKLAANDVDTAVENQRQRLLDVYGKRV